MVFRVKQRKDCIRIRLAFTSSPAIEYFQATAKTALDTLPVFQRQEDTRTYPQQRKGVYRTMHFGHSTFHSMITNMLQNPWYLDIIRLPAVAYESVPIKDTNLLFKRRGLVSILYNKPAQAPVLKRMVRTHIHTLFKSSTSHEVQDLEVWKNETAFLPFPTPTIFLLSFLFPESTDDEH